MNRRGRQGRRRLLELCQGRPVGPGHLFGQRGFEDRQRLAELHRAALELTEDPEDLFGGALLKFRGDDLGGTSTEPLTHTNRGPSGDA